MASIDQRIVELKFNGKNFKQGIQAAIASLDNLKKNLNLDKASSEFDKVEKASKKVTFRDLYSSVDSISNRFSTLGVIGMSALNQITTSAMQAGKKLLSALVSPLVEGGKRRALNIEQAKFQIEGLGYTWEQVEGSINYGVKDTAYGLDAAAKAASQLLASQVALGKEMDTSLRAISGVAAMTSSEYDDIAQIFTTVAGNGRLMSDQLLQLSTRGLNAAATLGQYLGKSESEVREMVTKGKIDFKTFAAAMDSAFGEHAKKANETFTGSLSNMKAALARIGAEFAAPAYTNLRDIFNSLTPVIDGVKVALGPLIETAKEGMSYLTKFATKTLDSFGGKEGVAAILAPAMEKVNRIVKAFGSLILGIARTIKGVVSPMISAFSEVLGGTLLDAFAGAIEILAKFFNSLAFTERMSNNLKKTFVGIFTVVNVLFKLLTKVVSLVSKTLLTVFSATFGFIADVVLAITGHIGDLIVRIQKFISDLLSLKTVQRVLIKIHDIFKLIKDVVVKVYSAFRDLTGIIVDSTFNSALWIFDKLASVILLMATYIDKAIMKLRDFINWLKSLPAVQNFIINLKNTFENIQSNIGGVASELKTSFIDAFEAARSVIGNFIENLKELISQYIELPTLQDVVTAVVKFMTTTFKKAVELFTKAKEVLGNIFDRVKELNEVSLRGIIDNFGKLKDKIVEVIDISGRLTFLNNMFGTIKDGAAEAARGTTSTLDLIKEKLYQFADWLKGKFNQLTMGDVMAAGIGGSFIVFLVQLTKFVKTADKLASSMDKVVNVVDSITKSITGAIDSFKALNKAKAQTIKMEAISNLIKSVVLLAGAVALLASMDPQRVAVSAGVILILAGGLIGLSTAMNAIATKTNPEAITASCIQMGVAAGSILALATALKLLSTIPVGKIVVGLIAITFMLGELVGFSLIFQKLAPEVSKDAFAMLLMATSIIVLARAMAIIGSMDVLSIMSSMAVVSVLVLALGIMFKLAGEVAMTKKSAIGIIAIVASLMLMVNAMKALAKIDSKTISLGLSRLMKIMGTFALLMIASKLAGRYAASGGVAILLISVAMNIMVIAIKKMAEIEDGMLAQATKSINEMLKIFALITLMTKFAGKESIKAGTAIMMMAGAIVIIAGAMILLSRLSEEDLKRSTMVITTILGMFALIVAATGMTKACQKTLKQMAICLGLLIAAVAVLSLIEPTNLFAASAAISMLLGTFALVLSAAKVSGKAMSAVWQLVGVVGVLAILLALLADLHAENALMAATALSELMLVIGGLLIAMNALNVKKVSVAAAAQLAAAIDVVILIIGALVVAVGALNTYIPELEKFLDAGIPIMQKIGQAIGEFVGGLIGGIAAGASYGLITLAENLNKFVQTLRPFMDEVSNIDDSAMEGCMKLVSMLLMFAAADFLAAIASFVGIASGGSIETLLEKLPMLGTAMTDFSKSLDGANLEALAVAAEAAKCISEVGFIFSSGGMKGFLFGDASEGLGKLGENLPLLGEGMKKYGDSVDGLKVDAINASVGPARALIEINNMIENEGGTFLYFFAGGKAEAVRQLSENLPLLGDALTAYGDSVDGLKADAINASVGPLRSLIEINNMIENEGSTLLYFFVGGKADAVRQLAENLPSLGDALTAYGDSVDGLKAEAIKASVAPLRSLIEINNMIENEGSTLLYFFVGGKAEAVRQLSENLPSLGEALTKYSNSLEGMKAGRINSSVDPLRALVEISNMIDNAGGAQSWIFGSSSEGVQAFSDNLPKLGEALSNYDEKVGEISADNITVSVDCIKTIIEVLNSVQGGISSIFGGGTGGGLTALNTNLPQLGESIKAYSDNVTDLSPEAVNNSVDAIKKIIEAVGTGGDYSESMRTLGFSIKEFSEAFRDSINNISELNYESVDEAVSSLQKLRDELANWANDFPDPTPSLTGFVEALRTAATSGVQGFVGAFQAGAPLAAAAALTMVMLVSTTLTTSLSRTANQFTQKGSQLMRNLANGMRSSSSLVTNALNNLLNQISQRIHKAASEMMRNGKSLVTNLANGMRNSSSLVVNAITNILNQVSQRINKAASDMMRSGRTLITNLANGMRNASSQVTNAISQVLSNLINKLNSETSQFTNKGKALVEGLANGIRNGSSSVSSAVTSTLTSASNKISGFYNNFYTSGKHVVEGLRNGILDNGWKATDAAYKVGRDVVQKLRDATKEKSPSREAKQIGKYIDMGLMIGIVNYASMAIGAAQDLGEDVIDEINPIADELSFFDGFEPVITPTIDTSYVDRGISKLNSDFASLGSVPIATQGRYISTALRNMADKQLQDAELQNGRSSQIVNNYDLTQNNYSPKALSRIEIYRDTRNQFSRLKEVVNA